MLFAACPTKCRCWNHTGIGLVVKCRGLNAVPDNIPDAANVIDMSENFMREFDESNNFDNCSNVKKLNLGLTRIKIIPQDLFQSMLEIETLVLNGNLLNYDNISFPNNPFENLTSLKSVSLHSWANIVTDLNEFGRILDMLPSTLDELNINIPGVVGIADIINKFKKLRKLSLYDAFSTNLRIQSGTFTPLQRVPIEQLKIKTGYLSYVDPLTFLPFPRLKTLDLSKNKGMTIADLSPALFGLKFTNVEKIKLSSFTRSNLRPNLVILNSTFLNGLAQIRRLVDLQMDMTEIYSINDTGKYLSQLFNLQRLNISFNFISMKDMGAIDWKRLITLRDLDISYQTFILWDIHFQFVVKLALPMNLSKLCLSHTRRTDDNLPIEIIISDETSVGHLNFPRKSLNTLSIFVVLGLDPDFNVSFEADFSSNNMVSFKGSLYKLKHNRFLVNSLLLQRNRLGQYLARNGEKIFKHFENVTRLDLSSNDIKNLPHSTFENQRELKYLNLSKNSIVSVNFKISHLKNIQIIDFSENLISQFDQQLQVDIDSLKVRSPNFSINMQGNPIQCSCETHTFLWWMYHKRSMFETLNSSTNTRVYITMKL